MKKTILLLALALIASLTYAQSDSTKTKLKPYASVGVSIGHVDASDPAIDNFSKASYPSLEVGFMGDNISLGAVVGCENFFVSSGSRGFYELKTAISKPIGKCSAYALFGAGAYMESGFNNFIEYGGGFSYMPGKFGYFVQYSNWARTNYVSTGITIGF
jgi:hypothetical protein